MSPRVSVLMPVYNTAQYLQKSILSILCQTYTDFEFIIIDDGSTDNSVEIIKEHAKHDARIVLLINDTNLKQSRSLNKGLQVARGEYIIRQDSDDISLPMRLSSSVDFMDSHPNVVVASNRIGIIDEDDNLSRVVDCPHTNEGVRALMLLRIPFIGAALIMRASMLKRHNICFDPMMTYGEDYDISSRLLNYGDGANIPDTLLLYRIRKGNDSDLFSVEQEATADRIALSNLQASEYKSLFSVNDIILLRSWQDRLVGLSVKDRYRQIEVLKRYLGAINNIGGIGSQDYKIIKGKLLANYMGGKSGVPSKKHFLGLTCRVALIDPLLYFRTVADHAKKRYKARRIGH